MATVRGNSARAIFRALACAALAPACEPNLVVGTWSCPVGPRVENDAGVLEPVTGPVASPWSTGFEQGLCDYYVAQGFCYGNPPASFEIVDSPVHAGAHAAAFTINTDMGDQVRCAREGTLPTDAYYGAWYYIPELHDGVDNWNLFHFTGGEPGVTVPGLWDVTLERLNPDDGKLHLFVRGPFGTGAQRPMDPVPIPIGSWFHIEFRLRRATDATGLVQLFQDDQLLVDLPGVQTENTSSFGQWYVGNLANALTPPDSTVYVDDVTIRPAP